MCVCVPIHPSLRLTPQMIPQLTRNQQNIGILNNGGLIPISGSVYIHHPWLNPDDWLKIMNRAVVNSLVLFFFLFFLADE